MEGARGVPGPRVSVNNGHESERAPGHLGGRTRPRPMPAPSKPLRDVGSPLLHSPWTPYTAPHMSPYVPPDPVRPSAPQRVPWAAGAAPWDRSHCHDTTGSAHRALLSVGSCSAPREPPRRGHLQGEDTSPSGTPPGQGQVSGGSGHVRVSPPMRRGSPTRLGAVAGEYWYPGAQSVLSTPFLPIPPRLSHLGTHLGGSMTAAEAAVTGGSSGTGPRGREQRPRPGQARGAPGRTPGRFPIAAPLSRERPLPASYSPGKW